MIDCSKTENFLKEKYRMCERIYADGCSKCPLGVNNGIELGCGELCGQYPDKAIEIVQKWSDEHPQKTILMGLLELLPNLPLKSGGVPYACPRYFGLNDYPPSKCKASKHGDCVACWNRPYEEGQIKNES